MVPMDVALEDDKKASKRRQSEGVVAKSLLNNVVVFEYSCSRDSMVSRVVVEKVCEREAPAT